MYYSIILVVSVHQNLEQMKKYFYEKNNLTECKVNITFHELLLKNGEELEKWIDELRTYIVDTWDNEGLPPRTGKNEKDIIANFNKLPVTMFTSFNIQIKWMEQIQS